MSRFNVLVTDFAWPSLEIERDILNEVDATLIVAETSDLTELVALAKNASAILTNWTPIPEAALDTARDCLVISRFGIGVDNIPVERATELGILVTNVPDFCLDEVSDHTMALLLACARQIGPSTDSTRRGSWDRPPACSITKLRGQTLGLVGFGQTARAIVPKALAFGLRVLAYAPRLSAMSLPADVAHAECLNELLAASDYVSLHVPATSETRHLLGEEELRLMRPTAYVINVARGSVIDEGALARALQEGWIAGAALDVLQDEPPATPHPLLSLDNVIVTPHTAFISTSSIRDLETKAARNVAAVLSGRLPSALVNTEVLERPNLRFRAHQ